MRLVSTIAVLLATISAPLAAGQTLSEHIAAVRRQQANRSSAERTKILQALQFTKVSLDFDETPARDVLDYLATLLGVNVVVRYQDDQAGHGLDPAALITVTVQEVPAVEALDLVLEQCSIIEQCTWQLRGTFLEIGTKERLSAPTARVTRIYPIDEMLFEAPRFENSPIVGLPYGYPGWVGAYDGDRGWGPYYGGPWGTGGWGYSGSIRPGPAVSTPSAATGPDLNSPAAKQQRAEEVIDLIVGVIEPDAWDRNGGEWAHIEYRDGALLVKAPDYIQRQIGGYPAVPDPRRAKPDPSEAADATVPGGGAP